MIDDGAAQMNILIFIDGLPILSEGRYLDRADILRRQVLHWVRDEQPQDLSKIYMPITEDSSYGFATYLSSPSVLGSNFLTTSSRFAIVLCQGEADAHSVIARLHGKVVDVNHTLSVERADESARFLASCQAGHVREESQGNRRMSG